MEHNTHSPSKFATNYGLVLGVIMILIAVLMYFSGMMLEGKQWPMIIYYILFPVIIIYCIMQYKKNNGNLLSLSEALKAGITTALISAIVYGLYNILFHYVIDPEFVNKIIAVTEEKLMGTPNIPPEVAEQQLAWVKKLSNPLLGSAFWIALSLFFGLFYSLISGLIMKKQE
ncbi:hypothetical protein PK35_05570 [Tamlana nanhaiensis]|uniref:DUF4199 domain-containing protein n=1 Tax=Neotamlana nanhaiensis TaxID=1382798 RepID=A0A0D7W6A7_9FLAO|nr:DUF4199 domain-containing protein [Tamlana nanhaiensis]KJD33327.1 hypothetical protein PK35_05570 [Tamlana nanhaiensis]